MRICNGVVINVAASMPARFWRVLLPMSLLRNLTINGGENGIQVQDYLDVAGSNSPVSNINLKNLDVNPEYSQTIDAHGIVFENASGSTIDSCVVGTAYANAAFL